MQEIVYIAVRYLVRNRWKTTALTLAISLVIYLPIAMQILVNEGSSRLQERAENTPLIAGAQGSALELALNALYFKPIIGKYLTYYHLLELDRTELGHAIPLYVRFRASGFPIVGTSIDYFRYRNSQLKQGRFMALLGEAVVGNDVATRLNLTVGDSIISSPENPFELNGVYPLKMKISGILAPSGSPDDGAVFVDIKTAWIIQGLGHGHNDLSETDSAAALLKSDSGKLVANASVYQYNEVNSANMDTFHFHGDVEGYPLTAIIYNPSNRKSSTLLQGRYQGPNEPVQIVQPLTSIKELMGTIFTIKHYVVNALLIIGLACGTLVAIVFYFSMRLRYKEMRTLNRIGVSPRVLMCIQLSEIIIVFLMAIFLATLLVAITYFQGIPWFQEWLVR